MAPTGVRADHQTLRSRRHPSRSRLMGQAHRLGSLMFHVKHSTSRVQPILPILAWPPDWTTSSGRRSRYLRRLKDRGPFRRVECILPHHVAIASRPAVPRVGSRSPDSGAAPDPDGAGPPWARSWPDPSRVEAIQTRITHRMGEIGRCDHLKHPANSLTSPIERKQDDPCPRTSLDPCTRPDSCPARVLHRHAHHDVGCRRLTPVIGGQRRQVNEVGRRPGRTLHPTPTPDSLHRVHPISTAK
jgi:hypothetical protein